MDERGQVISPTEAWNWCDAEGAAEASIWNAIETRGEEQRRSDFLQPVGGQRRNQSSDAGCGYGLQVVEIHGAVTWQPIGPREDNL